MKLAYATAVCLAFAVTPVEAQVVDMSTITCQDFAGRPADQKANIMFWLEGYYTDESDPTNVDFGAAKATLEKLLGYCSSNPTIGLLTAAEEVMGGDDEDDRN
jgi:acid stress chaperone HdeB